MKRRTPLISITDRLAALSEPLRLRIVRLLEAEELSVGEVAKVVQLPQSTVSRHLKILAETAWVSRRNEGTATLYRLVLDDLPPEPRALWLSVRGQMGHGPELAEDGARLRAVLAERRTDSQAFFGRVAGEWDSLRNSLFGTLFTSRALLSLLPRHWTVADLGCGTGNGSELLAPCVARVLAVDQSGPMLEAARKRLADFQNVEFIQGPLETLPLADSSVDATVCLLVLHHVPEPARAVAEMHRVLRPGGVALIVDMTEHGREEYRHTMGHRHLGFAPRTVESMLADAGFGAPRVQVLPGNPEVRGPGLIAATGVRPL
jgi:ubiquinone/menaquinone biosynthesis C-methylase UbiE/DNA-binding transcriptional ArsR family regulator